MSTLRNNHMSEAEQLDMYDELATKWAIKMEAKQRDKAKNAIRKSKGI